MTPHVKATLYFAILTVLSGCGGGANVSTTLLITPEEVDEAAKLTVNYRPPGE